MAAPRSSLETMIDAVVRCTVCNTLASVGCKCWDNPVELKCGACGKSKMVRREPCFFGMKVVWCLCPACRTRKA